MKLKYLFILATLLFVAVETYSQQDTRSEIINYQDSDFNFINKARRLLGSHIKDGNIVEANKVKDALLDEFGGEISEVFYNYEYIHTLYALGEYYELMIFMKQFDPYQRVSNNVYTSAQTDNLSDILLKNTLQYYDLFAIYIKENIKSDMERDFLLLLLKDISHYSQIEAENKEHKDNVNLYANKYLTNYPDSPYDKVVRENIRFEYEEANWGFYWDFGFSLGINNGELKNTLGNTSFGMEMILEYRYKKVLGQFEMGFVSSTLQKDVDINNTTWHKEASSTLSNFTLNAGYLAFENKRWSLYPLAGFGYAPITASNEVTKEDPNLKRLKLNTFYPQVGLGLDFKYFMPGYQDSPFGRLSLKYKYKIYNFGKVDTHFQGNQHTISLTYGIGGRPIDRKR